MLEKYYLLLVTPAHCVSCVTPGTLENSFSILKLSPNWRIVALYFQELATGENLTFKCTYIYGILPMQILFAKNNCSHFYRKIEEYLWQSILFFSFSIV
jgi:hypothetical protein